MYHYPLQGKKSLIDSFFLENHCIEGVFSSCESYCGVVERTLDLRDILVGLNHYLVSENSPRAANYSQHMLKLPDDMH